MDVAALVKTGWVVQQEETSLKSQLLTQDFFFHVYDSGHSPKAANIHEGHSGIQAEKGATVIQFHLVALVWLSNSPWKEKGLLEEFFLLMKGFGLEFMQFRWCPDHWPDLACGLTKLQGV